LFVNNQAKIYEIKTDLDDLTKAGKQAHAYLGCFTDVTFMLASGHVEAAMRQLPHEVGISLVNGRGHITVVRPSRSTEDYLSKEAIFNCLLKNEYRTLVNRLGGSDDMDYYQALALLEGVPSAELHRYLVKCLRAREQRKVSGLGWGAIPTALLAAAYSYQLSSAQWKSVLNVLDMPVTEVL